MALPNDVAGSEDSGIIEGESAAAVVWEAQLSGLLDNLGPTPPTPPIGIPAHFASIGTHSGATAVWERQLSGTLVDVGPFSSAGVLTNRRFTLLGDEDAQFQVVEDAIRQWVKAATGYDDNHVIWAYQSGPRPDGAFALIQMGDFLPLGAFDETVDEYDAFGDPGEEIISTVTGLRQFDVTVQVFTPEVTTGAAGRAKLAKCQTALGLSSVRGALDNAGITPFNIGPVQWVPPLNNNAFEGRALLVVSFYTLDVLTEFNTYIETAVPELYTGPPDSGTAEDIDI